MKKMTKWAVIAGIFLAATITSVSVFAASDIKGQTNDTTEQIQQDTWNENRRSHMQDQVDAGYMTQEEVDEMNAWMDERGGSCHGNNDGTRGHRMGNMNGSHGRGMGRQHNRMMTE